MDRALFEMGKIVNPVRNSSRCDSKPSGALAAPKWLRPRRRGIISNGVKDQA
jgi:hypothetical protein